MSRFLRLGGYFAEGFHLAQPRNDLVPTRNALGRQIPKHWQDPTGYLEADALVNDDSGGAGKVGWVRLPRHYS
jgi:hypothetical protein